MKLNLLDFDTATRFNLRVSPGDNEIYARKSFKVGKYHIDENEFMSDEMIKAVIAHKLKISETLVYVCGFSVWIDAV